MVSQKNSKRTKQNLFSSSLACLCGKQARLPHYQDQQPFSVSKTKQLLPPHRKRAQICFFAAFERQAGPGWGGGFSTSVSSIRLSVAAAGQETHCSAHQLLTPPGVSLQAGLEVLHTSSRGALKTRIAIKPSTTCCVRAGG